MWTRTTGGKKIKIGDRTAWAPVGTETVLHPEKVSTNFSRPGTGHGGFFGYEGDEEPLVYGKMGTNIHMTPVSSPMPSHGGFQQ